MVGALTRHPHFQFKTLEPADHGDVAAVFGGCQFVLVIHLAAQAGVRYSLQNPNAYIQSNLVGFQNILESFRLNKPEHLVFASSSSVYGNSKKSVFSEADNTDDPVSRYATTKKSNEVIAHSYAKLYGSSMTRLRFFTVCGPAGRPNVVCFDLTRVILLGGANTRF